MAPEILWSMMVSAGVKSLKANWLLRPLVWHGASVERPPSCKMLTHTIPNWVRAMKKSRLSIMLHACHIKRKKIMRYHLRQITLRFAKRGRSPSNQHSINLRMRTISKESRDSFKTVWRSAQPINLNLRKTSLRMWWNWSNSSKTA